MKWCVYMHTTPSEKRYIGITCQRPAHRRWRGGNAYRQQPYFWSAIQKYGWKNIKHEILADGLTKEAAQEEEKRLIALFNTNNQKYGYNCTFGGEGACGYTYTEEQRKRRSESLRGEKNPMYGRKFTQEERALRGEKSKSAWAKNPERHTKHSQCVSGRNNGNAKLIDVYKADGSFVCTVGCKAEAAELAGVSKATVKGSINRRCRPTGNYVFRNHGDPYNPETERYHDCKEKKVAQYTISGEYICEYNSATLAAKAVGTKPANIMAAARGVQKTSRGFIWRYVE